MILEAFEAMQRPASLRELADFCDLPVSSCHAVVQTLLQRGYLYTVGRRKELYPNRRIFSLARTIVEHDPFLARFAEQLEALRDETGETVAVAKRQGDVFVYLYTLPCPRPIGYAAKPGDFRPLHSTASGKALLSVLMPEEMERWLTANPLKATTTKTITSKQRLVRDIEAGRQRGYFFGAGEYTEDADAVAVPVLLPLDVVAVSIAGPIHRMKPMMESFGKRLVMIKKEMESAGSPPGDAHRPERHAAGLGGKAAERAT